MSRPQRKPATAKFILDAGRAIGVVAEEKPQAAETPEQRQIGFLCRRLDAVLSELDAVHRENAGLRQLVEAEPPKDWLTTEQAAALVGRSAATIGNWCRDAHIVGIGKQVKGRWQVNRAHLRRYLVERFGAARLPEALR